MDLKEYFDNNKGFGVMSTANSDGEVDAAIYSRPHVVDDKTLAVIMRDRLTHKNLETNPNAVYLFMEEGGGYKGKRIFLKKIREEKDSDSIEKVCRKCSPKELLPEGELRFLVVFEVTKVLPLIGAGK